MEPSALDRNRLSLELDPVSLHNQKRAAASALAPPSRAASDSTCFQGKVPQLHDQDVAAVGTRLPAVQQLADHLSASETALEVMGCRLEVTTGHMMGEVRNLQVQA